MSTPYVADLGEAHAVIIPSWHSYSPRLDFKCRKDKGGREIPKNGDMYILCDDQSRADEICREIVRSPSNFLVYLSSFRTRIYGGLASSLISAGHAVIADGEGPECDDRRIKSIYPPPAGPAFDFRWDFSRRMLRLRCLYSHSDGSIASQRVNLPNSDDWGDAILKAYARFSKHTMPAAPSLMCLQHVARKLSRLDDNATLMLSAWKEKMAGLGIDRHQDHAPLVISSHSIHDPGDLVSIELKGVRGSYLLSATCTYVGGTRITDKSLVLKADIPETAASGMVGSDASRLWGDEDLNGVVLSRITKARKQHEKDARHYALEAKAVDLVLPQEPRANADDALVELTSERFRGLSIEPLVLFVMRDMSPAARLHVYRTLAAMDDRKLDLSPWLNLTGHSIEIQQQHNIISYASSGSFLRPMDGIEI